MNQFKKCGVLGFSFFQQECKDREKRDIDFLKTLPKCRLSYLANFPEETVQLENGPNSIRVSRIILSKYFIYSTRFIFTEDENVYEL